jgi:hypothetical protein
VTDVSQMIAWAVFAAVCTRASWHRAEAVIGLALLVCSLVTSAAYFGSSFDSRLVLEICQGLCVTFTARIAFRGSRSPWSAVIVILAAADVAVAGVLSWSLISGTVTERAAAILLGWASNIIFLLQCLLVGVPGIYDVVCRSFRSRAPRRGMDYASGARDVARDQDGSGR